MNQISLLVRIRSTPAEVFDKISTERGIEEWFCRASFSKDEDSGELYLRLWDTTDFRVTELATPSRMTWQCISEGNPWYGTDVVFELKTETDKTVVVFDHSGWPEISDFYRDCAMSWGYFLESLRSLIEEGAGTPEDVSPGCEADPT